MKSIIIDTSALIAAILDEPEKARLVELTADVNLLAPESLHWEVGNAFLPCLEGAVSARKMHGRPLRSIR